MRLVLDHHYSPAIATALRQRGLDAVAAVERGWHALGDEYLLEACAAESSALVTNNVRDFVALARTWAAEGRRHHGLIFTADRTWPRSRDGIGSLTDALAMLTERHREGGLPDGLLWLEREAGP